MKRHNHAIQLRKNSPRHTKPRRTSPKKVYCFPAHGLRSAGSVDFHRRLCPSPSPSPPLPTAQEPVPEDCVSPTRRVQRSAPSHHAYYRLRLVSRLSCVKCELRWISAACACQSFHKLGNEHYIVGIAHRQPESHALPYLTSSMRVPSRLPASPFRFETHIRSRCAEVRVQVFRPAPPVWIVIFSFPCSEHKYAATQRVPLPEISASEPSAFDQADFGRRPPHAEHPSRPPIGAHASADREMRFCECRNICAAGGARETSINRKSLPQALAFTNGIVRTPEFTLGPPGRGKSRQAVHFDTFNCCRQFLLLRGCSLHIELHADVLLVLPLHVFFISR